MVEVVGRRAHLVSKAAHAGRIRGTALDLLDRMRAQPATPGRVLTRGLREARYLHSGERRLVGDGVRAVLRHAAVLDACTGSPTDAARWLGWLVSEGLEPHEATTAYAELVTEGPPARFVDVTDLDAASRRAVEGLEPRAAAAILGSCSTALADAMVESLGDEVPAFLAASNVQGPVGLRVNLARIEREEAARALARAGIETRPMARSPAGLEVVGRANVVGSAPYRDGLVEIQDEGSQLLAALVAPDEGPIVDLCAGAGGKTLAIAAAAPHARILATDVRGRALDELHKRARRAGVRHLQTARLDPDGGLPDALRGEWSGRASRVLVDAPCSGTGTLRRHPEHRLRLDADTLTALPALQASILDRAADLVAPGGRLVYGTCSVLRMENDDIVSEFVARHARFVARPAPLRLAPHTHGTDGFFGVVLERT